MADTVALAGGRQVPGIFREYGAVLVRACRTVDTALIVCAFLLTMREVDGGGVWFSGRPFWLDALVCILILQTGGSFFRLGRSWRMVRLRYELFELFVYWLACFTVTMAVFSLAGDFLGLPLMQWVMPALAWFALAFFLVAGARGVVRMGLRYYRASGNDRRSAVIVGAGSAAERLSQTFKDYPWMGIDVVSIFDNLSEEGLARALETIVQRAERGGLSAVYLTMPIHAHERVSKVVEALRDTTVSIFYCPPLADLDLVSSRWDDVFGQPVFSIVDSPFEGFSGALKRAEDCLICLLAAPILLPVGLLCALAVRLTSKGPVIYRQTRYGLDGKPFVIRKFRTMYMAEPDEQYRQATRDDPRVTTVGRFLRKSSLDELPQFINVLGGSMSVVGPRPHPIKLDEKFKGLVPRYVLRHKIKPGITGLAQVNGWRGETETLEKMQNRVQQDILYLREWSLWLDMTILLRTLLVPFRTKGVY